MSINIKTVSFEGVDILPVETQVHIANGMPSLTIVGLGDKAIKESKDRIKAALTSLGLSIPPKRITVNLSPSDIIKEGALYDLPIAVGLLAAMDVIPLEFVENYVILGELALDGRILPVSGVLPSAMYANAIECGIICPEKNGVEACMAGGDFDIIACQNLIQLINHIKGETCIQKPQYDDNLLRQDDRIIGDFYDIRGQFAAKRAVEIAASGGHNILMYGSPGTGKSMLASRMASIIPDMSIPEMLETSIVRSIAGDLKSSSFSTSRPYRDPHHSASLASIVGGGKNANPGEISLAHNGILFLDELSEFPRTVLDSLRQPIENGYINVSRANKHVTYPAKFQLVAAMNPCKCGYFGNEAKQCKKVPVCAQEYQSKISGPIMDRIDIHIEVGNFVPSIDDDGSDRGERSDVIRERVLKTREIQANRYENENYSLNHDLVGDAISKYCILDDEAKQIMKNATEKLDLSMRSHNKILKVARTIADMKQNKVITSADLFEALSYRPKLV